MIRISRAWIAHHKVQYGSNWRHIKDRFYAELKQAQGGR